MLGKKINTAAKTCFIKSEVHWVCSQTNKCAEFLGFSDFYLFQSPRIHLLSSLIPPSLTETKIYFLDYILYDKKSIMVSNRDLQEAEF